VGTPIHLVTKSSENYLRNKQKIQEKDIFYQMPSSIDRNPFYQYSNIPLSLLNSKEHKTQHYYD